MQEDIKLDIKRHIRERTQIAKYLDTLATDFEANKKVIGEQEWKMKGH